MLFQVSFNEGNATQSVKAKANTKGGIRLWFAKNKPTATINGISEQTEAKPGMPVIDATLPPVSSVYKLNTGYILVIFEDGKTAQLCAEKRTDNIATVKDIENGAITATETAKAQAYYTRLDEEREEQQAKQDSKNRATCKRIANEVELAVSGNEYKCPLCGEIHSRSDYEETEHENEDGETVYSCPHCGGEFAPEDLEEFTLYDYLNDVLDVDFICSSRGEYYSARFAVALGGPGIYLDTDKKAVCLYWWGDKAQFSLSSDAVDALDEYGQEMFECMRG